MKPPKNFQNEIKNWQQFYNEIQLNQTTSYSILTSDILQVYSEKYKDLELKD
jgi:hypothetical protein